MKTENQTENQTEVRLSRSTDVLTVASCWSAEDVGKTEACP